MVQAVALDAYGRMVHDCKDNLESLMASKLLSTPLTHMPASQRYRIVVRVINNTSGVVEDVQALTAC